MKYITSNIKKEYKKTEKIIQRFQRPECLQRSST
jgi:hypothetical protein